MNYLTNDRKKKDRLARLELALRRLISRDAPLSELLKAAAEVRDARVRVLQLKKYHADRTAKHYPKILAAIEATRTTATETILAEFLPAES